MFIFTCLGSLGLSTFVSVHAQGIGDRNRPAGRGTYKIVGKVFLPDSKPAVGVDVSVSGADFNNGSTRTDHDGAFVLPGLPSGNYTVSVRESGYRTESESLTIAQGNTSGQSFQIVFHLRQSGQPRAANPLLSGIPKNAVLKFDKGMEKLAANDAKGAIVSFDEAVTAHPQFAVAYYEKGAAHLKLNEPDKALESFVKAVSIKPDYLEAKYSVGYTQYLKKNYEVAAAVFDDVLKQKKDMPEAHMYLGISLYQLKNVDAAESELKLAISTPTGEKLPMAHLFLGGIYAQKKRKAEAVSELQKYVDLMPKAPNAEKIKATIADLKKP